MLFLKLMVLIGRLFERKLDHEVVSYSNGITAIVDAIQEDTPHFYNLRSKRTHPHFYNLMVYSECTVSVAQSGLLLDAQSSGDFYF